MRFLHRIGTAFLIMLCVLGAALIWFAAPTRAATLHPHDPSGHVTIIVLDMSGSMAQNDPNGYRCSAANAYIDLSRPGSFIGVIGLDNNNGATGGPHNF